MSEQDSGKSSDTEKWLETESHGDPLLYELLRDKETLGQRIASGEISHGDAVGAFQPLNEQISQRLFELGIDPTTFIPPPSPEEYQ